MQEMEDRNARLRRILRPYRAKSDAFAVALFIADCAMYGICTTIAAGNAPMVIRLVAGTAAGVLLAVLFVIGHDACPGSFTSRSWLNLSVGRIVFLPTLTPFSTWEL
jgi:acyl-lipid omega-6 desaturase (Delta-12 desaturase)